MVSASYNNPNASSSSASTSSPRPWDVFLSFRGKDTRNTFTGHLYEALDRIFVRTFRDEPKLGKGKIISEELLRAIEESKAYVVIFSENYADSKWCLDELVAIESKGRLIIPVFYHIHPWAVRNQEGSFHQAFIQHENNFDNNKVLKWRVALKAAGEKSGYHIVENVSEADIIKKIVRDILNHINPKTLDVTTHPVGLVSRIEDITSLLSSTEEGPVRIGIYGMGGVGKTTLAKAVFNQHYHRFQGSCFLADVRNASDEGLVRLQQQLIDNVVIGNEEKVNNFDHGVDLIKDKIQSVKVLIVIDDLVLADKPLKFLRGPFAQGSRIIITTRNEDLLDSITVEKRYRVNVLSNDESRQLFTQHAFGNNVTMLNELSGDIIGEIIERAGGLPLALRVFGSELSNKLEDGWRYFLHRIKQDSINDVKKDLIISYNALEVDDLRHIFLDIACLFIGWEEEEVVKIMETYYTLVKQNIGILKKRSLLTINSTNKLMAIHNQLRDMGREIARNNSPRNPEKHSRLWVREDILRVFKKRKGTNAIEGIVPAMEGNVPTIKGVPLTRETFTEMSKLRFLHLEDVDFTGNFGNALEDLVWLRWSKCALKFLPSSFYLQNLLVLELPGSKLRTMWEPNMVSPIFEMLKTLNMSYSVDLTTIPDFNKLPCLETLNLEGCESLEEVHISIGSLVNLASLNLGGCVKLRSLPNTICNLTALEALCIANCSSLEGLPTQLGNVESLKSGKVASLLAGAVVLFDKILISQFSNSKNPELQNCSHPLSSVALPPSLKWMKADGCTSMKSLPNVSNLKQLEKLHLKDCSNLTEIPGWKELTSIRGLHLGGCNSSLLANTLTEPVFQGYSVCERQINFYIGQAEFPDWISQPSNSESTVSVDLPSDKFLAMIFCFKRWGGNLDYHIKNTTSELICRGSFGTCDNQSLIVLVPKSIFSLRDGKNKIIVSATAVIYGYHVLKETEVIVTHEYDDSSTVNDGLYNVEGLIDSDIGLGPHVAEHQEEEVEVMEGEDDRETIRCWNCIEGGFLCQWRLLAWLWCIRRS